MPQQTYTTADSVAIDTTGTLLTLTDIDPRTTVAVSVAANVSSDFELQVDFGDGSWVTWATYGATDTVNSAETVAARSVRIQNTTGQTGGDTADVKLAASP